MVGGSGLRAVPHEGLDLYSFADAGGRIKTVDQQTQIPAAFAGQVVKIDPDFLGKSIYISHAILYGRRPAAVVRVWTHRPPGVPANRPDQVAAGEIIAAVSGFPGKKTSLPPHLHLTFAWVPVRLPAGSAYLEKSGAMIPGSRSLIR